MVGNDAEKYPTWSTMMAKPEISSKGMKEIVPHGAKPNRAKGPCSRLRWAAKRNIVRTERGLLPAHTNLEGETLTH